MRFSECEIEAVFAFGASVWLKAPPAPAKVMAIATEQARIAFRYIFNMVETKPLRIRMMATV